MARTFNDKTLKILKALAANPGISVANLQAALDKSVDYKSFHNALYRLKQQELLESRRNESGSGLYLTEEGARLIRRFRPERDGVWKLVIFDIPEKQKYVRVVLRSKLKALHFKKWQNSIWISPYKLDEEIEAELNELSKRFFVRLIKTNDINKTDDLEKLF
ncbi:MAG: hypothetical protein KGJ93_04090 [Patescibacteria group bacterium]|nr:hypothetical protein [Patescibacteria group bacterium]